MTVSLGVFVLVGTAFGAFSAWKAFDGFNVRTDHKPRAWWIHQIWFNFLGAWVGWGCAWLLAARLAPCVLDFECRACQGLSWSDAVLGLVAFLGMTGHVPLAAFGWLKGLERLALKASGAHDA